MLSTKQEAKFPLAGLNTLLLEKIITKMDTKSYIQMQQTCHGMKDFIQQNANIKGLPVDGFFEPHYPYADCDLKIYYCPEMGPASVVPVTAFVGLRVHELNLRWIGNAAIDSILDILLKCRIECDRFYLDQGTGDGSKENMLKILDNLKPRSVSYYGDLSKKPDVLDAILESRLFVKSVEVETKDTEEILAMAKILLPVFSDVYIYYNCQDADYPDSARDIAMTGINRRVLECFFSMNCPHLKQFTFVVARYEDKEDDGRNDALGLVLPKHFPDGATMNLITGGRGDDSFFKISYHRN